MERILVFRNVFLNKIDNEEFFFKLYSKDCNYFNFVIGEVNLNNIKRAKNFVKLCDERNFPYMFLVNNRELIDIVSGLTDRIILNINDQGLLDYCLKKISFILVPLRFRYLKYFKKHASAGLEGFKYPYEKPQYCFVKIFNKNPFPEMPLFRSDVSRNFFQIAPSLVDNKFDFLKSYKSICLCGNGPYNYEENISNKIIDNSECVVRMNTYHIVPNISGEKTTIHCMFSTDQRFHDDDNPIYKNNNEGDYVFISNDKLVNKRLFKLCKLVKPHCQINFNLIDRFMNNVSKNKKRRLTGLYCMIFFACVKLKYNTQALRVYGIGNHEIVDNSQQYYFGNREIDDTCIKHHLNHNWNLQKYIYDFFKYLKIIDE